jgi:hypothetical protein
VTGLADYTGISEEAWVVEAYRNEASAFLFVCFESLSFFILNYNKSK